MFGNESSRHLCLHIEDVHIFAAPRVCKRHSLRIGICHIVFEHVTVLSKYSLALLQFVYVCNPPSVATIRK